jgi:hypothetical protein
MPLQASIAASPIVEIGFGMAKLSRRLHQHARADLATGIVSSKAL